MGNFSTGEQSPIGPDSFQSWTEYSGVWLGQYPHVEAGLQKHRDPTVSSMQFNSKYMIRCKDLGAGLYALIGATWKVSAGVSWIAKSAYHLGWWAFKGAYQTQQCQCWLPLKGIGDICLSEDINLMSDMGRILQRFIYTYTEVWSGHEVLMCDLLRSAG